MGVCACRDWKGREPPLFSVSCMLCSVCHVDSESATADEVAANGKVHLEKKTEGELGRETDGPGHFIDTNDLEFWGQRVQWEQTDRCDIIR